AHFLRPQLEALEDRLAPAVTASLVGTTLQVQLDAVGDTANVAVAANAIEVRDGTNTLLFAAPLPAVTALNIQGNNLANQAAQLNSAFNLSGAVDLGQLTAA